MGSEMCIRDRQKLEDKAVETKSGDLSVHDLTKRKFELSKVEQQAASEAERNTHLQGEHKTNLFFVPVGSHFHERSVYIALHPRFNNFILLLILLSSLALAMECPATYVYIVDKIAHAGLTYSSTQIQIRSGS